MCFIRVRFLLLKRILQLTTQAHDFTMSRKRKYVDNDAEAWLRRDTSVSGNVEPTQSQCATPLLDSKATALLLDLRCSIGLPAYIVQQIAAAIAEDADSHPQGHPALRQLVSMGSAGNQPQNVARDIDAALQMSSLDLCAPLFVPCWCTDRRRNPPRLTKHKLPLMLPHEILSCLYNLYPDEFNKRMLGPPGTLESFWSDVQSDDIRFYRHPVRQQTDYKEKALLLRLHGDGVPYGKGSNRSLDVVSMSCPFGEGSPFDTSFLLMAIPASIAIANRAFNTKHQLWVRLRWSFSWCVRGIHPCCDWHGDDWTDINDPDHRFRTKAGQNLMGGYLGALAMLGADCDYLSNVLRFHSNYVLPPYYYTMVPELSQNSVSFGLINISSIAG